jgi:hypothetical protein
MQLLFPYRLGIEVHKQEAYPASYDTDCRIRASKHKRQELEPASEDQAVNQ